MDTEVSSIQPERQTQVWKEIAGLETSVVDIGMAIDELAGRLGAVLVEPYPEEEAEPKDSEAIVALAGNIRGNTHKIVKICTFVKSLTKRLEL